MTQGYMLGVFSDGRIFESFVEREPLKFSGSLDEYLLYVHDEPSFLLRTSLGLISCPPVLVTRDESCVVYQSRNLKCKTRFTLKAILLLNSSGELVKEYRSVLTVLEDDDFIITISELIQETNV